MVSFPQVSVPVPVLQCMEPLFTESSLQTCPTSKLWGKRVEGMGRPLPGRDLFVARSSQYTELSLVTPLLFYRNHEVQRQR